MFMFILFSLMMLTVGTGFGVLLRALYGKENVRRLEAENRKLHKEVAYLRKIQKGKVIEIKDERLGAIAEVSFPNKERF